jgi:hypothetical protein
MEVFAIATESPIECGMSAKPPVRAELLDVLTFNPAKLDLVGHWQ